MSKSETCPPVPSLDQKFEKIQDVLNAGGANQKCKSVFNSAVDSGMTKVDAAAAAFVFPFGGGGVSTSFTESQNKMRESLNKEGCSDLFMNINQQINSTQSILCEVSNTKSTTSLSGSANASIKIIQPEPTEGILAQRTAALNQLIKPVQPLQPGLTGKPVTERDIELYTIAMQNYNDAIKVHKQEMDDIMGKVTISRTTFKNVANVDMQAISNLSNISTTSIAEQYKQTAQASAVNELKNKTGLGANSDTVKSLVANKISNKNQSITQNIKNMLQNTTMSSQADASVLIKSYGAIDITGVTFDQHAQSRLITKNIISSASNLGKSIALDILSDAHSVTQSDKEATGQDKVLKELFEGQEKLSKTNAEGAAKMFKGVTGFLSSIASMFALIPIVIGVVILLFFPQVSNIIAPGPLKYVLAGVLMYLIFAYFIGFWPFGKSEKKQGDEDYDERDIFPGGLGFIRTIPKSGKHPYRRHHFSTGY
tara:strand:- start:4025 stop:5470 length:1446 start_codon:yes stop_codon:yes gene_type:complete